MTKPAPFTPAPVHGCFRCTSCKKQFWIVPGSHEHAFCPHCRSNYYEWLDYGDWALPPRPESGYPLGHVRSRRRPR